MEIIRHFTVSIYVIYNNKVLLHKHKKYGIMLPVGGHIERDELPHEAALKEVKEESGLSVKLYDSNKLCENRFEKCKTLNRGEYLNVHKVGPQHEHIDFIFYARASSDDLNPCEGESKYLSWYSKEEIENLDLEDAVKYYALEALDLLKD